MSTQEQPTEQMTEAQAYAARHNLPRVVWQAQGYRLVEYDEARTAGGDGPRPLLRLAQRRALQLEERQGHDMMGQERWAPIADDSENWFTWKHALLALVYTLFGPHQNAIQLQLPLADEREDDDEEEGTEHDIPY